jgi:adenosylcobinamide-GDP ribazoletransferase
MGDSLKSFLIPFFTAVRFLTLFPVSLGVEKDGDSFAASLYYFPLVGGLIGLAAFFLAEVLLLILPVQVAAVLAVGFLAFVSGCLHLDGLADSADGLLSARPRERALEIMKDSRTGSMGVVAVVFLLLGKYSALASMENHQFRMAVFFMPLAGRCFIIFAMSLQRYARSEGGLGQLFYSGMSRKACFPAVFFLIGCFLYFAGLQRFLLFAVVVIPSFLLFLRLCHKKLGGATGDTLGALCEIVETAVAVSFAFIV